MRRKTLDLVLKIKDRRAKLLGLDKPMRTEITGADGGKVQIEYVNDWRGEE